MRWITVCLALAIGSMALASGGPDWFRLHTKEELAELLKEYDKYLYEAPKGPDNFIDDVPLHPKHTKAVYLYTFVKGHHDKLIKAELAFKKSWEKETLERKKKNYERERMFILSYIEKSHFQVWDRKLAKELPKEVVEEFFWRWKVNGESKMLKEFGSRAEFLYEPIRKYGIESGKIEETKAILQSIKSLN